MIHAAWVQSNMINDPEKIQSVVRMCKGRITDLLPIVATYAADDPAVLGKSRYCKVTPIRIDGITPMEYLIRVAHDAGIKVHAWWVIYQFHIWGDGGILLRSFPDTEKYHNRTNGGSTIQFKNAAVRSPIRQAIVDFHLQNQPDGIHLDYIRTDSQVYQTLDEVSMLVMELRRAAPKVSIGYCSIARKEAALNSPAGNAQDGGRWAREKWVNCAYTMSYMRSLEDVKLPYLREHLLNVPNFPVYYGLSAQQSPGPQDYLDRMWAAWDADERLRSGFSHFCIPQGLFEGSPTWAAIDAFNAGRRVV